MGQLARLREAVLAALALIGSLATLALMLHVCADVVLRNLWNWPIPATYEVVVNYYMVALAFIPLAFVERSGAMIQVDALEGFLGPLARRVADAFVILVSAIIYGALAWVTVQAALRQTAVGAFVTANQIRVPVWPAYWLPPTGFALAGVAVLLKLPALFGTTRT